MANITLKDFITQCQLYEHSTEHYDLTKECSELVLLEQYIDNQLFLMENAELLESTDVAFEDGYFQESANESSLDAIMESANEKKGNIFQRIWTGFKKLVERFANFLLKCAGAKRASDMKDEVDALKNALSEKNKEAEDLIKKLADVQNQLGVTIVALRSEKEKGSRTIAEKQAAIAKYQKMVVNKNRDLAASKAENDRLGKEVDTYKGMAESSANSEAAYKAMYDDIAADLRALNVRSNHESKACDPIFLIDSINKYVDYIRSGNSSGLTGLEKAIDQEIQRVRNDGIAINLGEKQLNVMASNLKKAINDADADESGSTLNGTGYVTAKNVYTKLNEAVGSTCDLFTKGVKFDNIRTTYVANFNKKFKENRDRK